MVADSKSSTVPPNKSKKGCSCLLASGAAIVLVIVSGIALGPMTGSISKAKALSEMVTTRALAMALSEYASAHNGQYPIGNSSTEVFQKLMDEGYVTDPSIFVGAYPRHNKVPLTYSNQKLKPENVGFDVTVPIDTSSWNRLPVVFLTGYRISYQPGASAVPLSDDVKNRIPCMSVGYNDGTAAYFSIGDLRLPSRGYSNSNNMVGNDWGPGALSDGTIPNFVPNDFDSKGKVYRQLTPTGELPP
jgi:type II secretory pathway pseudopilin PulG